MHGRKRTIGTIIVRHAQGKEGKIGMRESWMHSEKGARARGRIGKWCVITVMVKTTMPVDSDSMYALAHLEFQNQDLDATCAEDLATRVRIARRPVEDITRPHQEKEEDKKDKDTAKERVRADVQSAGRQIIGKMNAHNIPTRREARPGSLRAPGEPKAPRARADPNPGEAKVALRGAATIVEGRTGR